MAGVDSSQAVGQHLAAVGVAGPEPSDAGILGAVLLNPAGAGVGFEERAYFHGFGGQELLSPPCPCPVVVERRGPDAVALVRRRRGVAAAPGPADGLPGGHRRAVDRAAGPVAVTPFPLPFRDVYPTVLVLHVKPHRLPDARLLHVRLQHTTFVDVGDANRHVQTADAGAVSLLPGLHGNLVAVVSVGVGWLLEVRNFVEREDAAATEREVLTVGARQDQVYALAVRVGGRVGGQRRAGVRTFLELQAAWTAHHRRFVHVLDGDGDGNGVRQPPRVGRGDRYEMLLPPFAVQLGLGAKLTGGLDDLEFVGGGDAVGEPVVVAVGGGHGRADVPSGRQVLADAAIVVAVRREHGRLRVRRSFLHPVGADGDGGLVVAVAVVVGGNGPQVAAHVGGGGCVGPRIGVGDGGAGATPAGGAVPLPGGSGGFVVVIQRGRKRRALLGLHRGQG